MFRVGLSFVSLLRSSLASRSCNRVVVIGPLPLNFVGGNDPTRAVSVNPHLSGRFRAVISKTTTEKGELRARTALRAHLGKREEKEKKPLRCDAARVPPLRAAAMATSWQQPATINDGGPPCLPEPAR